MLNVGAIYYLNCGADVMDVCSKTYQTIYINYMQLSAYQIYRNKRGFAFKRTIPQQQNILLHSTAQLLTRNKIQ